MAPAFAAPLLGGVVRSARKRLAERSAEGLASHVEKGEHVVAAVDADELERRAGRDDRLSSVARIPGQGVEVPVRVVSVDRHGPDGANVVLDDGGGSLGRRTIPIEAFEAAWHLAERLAYVITHSIEAGRAGQPGRLPT